MHFCTKKIKCSASDEKRSLHTNPPPPPTTLPRIKVQLKFLFSRKQNCEKQKFTEILWLCSGFLWTVRKKFMGIGTVASPYKPKPKTFPLNKLKSSVYGQIIIFPWNNSSLHVDKPNKRLYVLECEKIEILNDATHPSRLCK